MKRERPGVFSVRAANQYRHRDILTYLGLRYYLHNTAACTDHWAKQVATDLVLTRTNLPYFRALHFKETASDGKVLHRPIFLPCANEALAEAALLAECTNHPHFSNPECVFSYDLSCGNDRSGIFQQYMRGLRARHDAIAKACDDYPAGMVRYTDIKTFYPSITTDLALKVWLRYSSRAGLAERYRSLGEKIINDHAEAGGQSQRGILTGPMFSHLLANLVLREMDEECSKILPARYFRYVDDITLVGDQAAIAQSLGILHRRLGDLGLNLHEDTSPKNFEVSTAEWLEGRDDFRESKRLISWPALIGDLKRFMLQHPEERGHLQQAFRNEGFRLPIHDYSGAIYETTWLERVCELTKNLRFRCKAQAVSIQALLHQALWLRKTYEEEFRSLIEGAAKLNGYSRKRRVPKLRYRVARLIYLGTSDTLAAISLLAEEFQELHYHAEIMRAVASGDINGVLSLGSNAARAAAQPLRAAGKPARSTIIELSDAQQQSLAVFLFHGVAIDCPRPKALVESEILRFARTGVDITLMKSTDPFIRELACLHGLTNQPRHPEILDSVFDKDEELAMDAIDQLQNPLSP